MATMRSNTKEDKLLEVLMGQSISFAIMLEILIDNAWMISGLKLSSTLPKVASKS